MRKKRLSILLCFLFIASFAQTRTYADIDPKSITQTYFSCFKGKNKKLFKSLVDPKSIESEFVIGIFGEGKKVKQYWYEAYLEQNTLENLEIISISQKSTHFTVEVEYKMKGKFAGTEVLYIKNDGVIKYAPFLKYHPGYKILTHLDVLHTRSKGYGKPEESLQRLKDLNIPLFGFSLQKSIEDNKISLKKIVDWWRNNYQIFIDNEGIPLSEYHLKEIKQGLEIISRYFD